MMKSWVSHINFLEKAGFIVYLAALKKGAIQHAHPYYVIYRQLAPPPPPETEASSPNANKAIIKEKNIVKPVFSSHSNEGTKTKYVFKTDNSLMQVENIAECSSAAF